MSEIEWYLDELFDQLAGTGAAGRRALMEAEYHLRTAAADAMARELPEDQAEHEAVSRFGPPALVARKMRSAQGAGRLNRAVSTGLAAGRPGGLRARCGLPGCGLVAHLADTRLHRCLGLWLLHHWHARDAGHRGHDDRRCRCRVAARPLARRQVRSTGIHSPRIRVAVAVMKQSRSKLAALRLAWGPDAHSGSNWDKPGDEWGAGYVFTTPGCWDLRAIRGDAIADAWIQVVTR